MFVLDIYKIYKHLICTRSGSQKAISVKNAWEVDERLPTLMKKNEKSDAKFS